MILTALQLKPLLNALSSPLFPTFKLGWAPPTPPFRLDVHVLLTHKERLVAHEYLLGVTPQQCGQHLDELCQTYDLEIIYDYAGRLEADGQQVPILSTKAWQRFETVEHWLQREPQTVQDLLQPAQLHWEDLADEDCQLWAT
jgi:hypothetical protein